MPVALGVALARKLRGEDGIAVVFIGDGTLGQGALYESMNLASLWGVRLLIVLEDNQIAQTTPSSVGVAGDILARAEAFGIDAAGSTAPTLRALQDDFAALVETMRGREAPAFRVVAHGSPRPAQQARRRALGGADGRAAHARTRSPGLRPHSTTADADQADRDAGALLDAALARAEASPEPDQLAHLGDVYPQLDEAAAVRPWARRRTSRASSSS